MADTIADIGFIGYDIGKIISDNILGDENNLGENCLALGADGLGAIIPFGTGFGLGVRAGSHSDDVAKALNKIDPNKLKHIFGQEKHKLDKLLDRFGGDQEKAYRALDAAAQKAFKDGKLNLKNGINTETRVNVNGVDVDLVGGRAVNDKFHIGSASRRDVK